MKKDNIKLINFIDLTKKKKEMILTWRNHPSIKKWMYDSDDITLQNHMLFIEHLKDSSDKLYFLIQKDGEYIGVVDFTNINEQSCDFGLYSNPKLKGIGDVLLDSICKYAFENLNINKLYAEVFTKNEKAIHLYDKFNFKEIEKKLINNKEVICMELKNENR